MPLFYYKEKRESNVKSNIFRRFRRDQLFSACVALFLSIKQQGGMMLILSRASYVAFAAFGLFWGTWGALLPALRSQASLTDAQFGTVLLFIGVGALPAMLLSGRAVDRWGIWVAGIMLISLAVAATIVGATAHNFVSASISMLLLGLTSGASDVAINSLAGRAEQQTGSRIITRSHGVFSLFVVIGSLVAGAARSVNLNPLTIFLSTAVVILILGKGVARLAKTSDFASGGDVRGGERPALGSFAPFAEVAAGGRHTETGFAAQAFRLVSGAWQTSLKRSQSRSRISASRTTTAPRSPSVASRLFRSRSSGSATEAETTRTRTVDSG